MTTTPRLESCYFPGQIWQWERLARVLALTAERQCPDWRISVRSIQPVSRIGRHAPDARNVEKIDEWCRIVTEAPDGDRVLLIDADTFIVNPLDSLWVRDFDLAYTVRTGASFPFNAGVIFLRVSERTKAFMQDWCAENLTMLGDRRYHQMWSARYGGINQAALGALIRRGALAGLQVLPVPCAEWNCEDSSWEAFDPKVTRIVHVKSALRRALFYPEPLRQPGVARLVKLWRSLDTESNPAAKTA